MIADRDALEAFIRSRRDEHMRLAAQIGAANPDFNARGTGADGLAQMVDGFHGLIFEALEGRSTEQVDFYVAVVVPGLLSSGTTLAGMMYGFTAWAMLLMADVARNFTDATDREEAVGWFAQFMGRHAHRMIGAAGV